ncbi:MAG: phosphoadenosine phosphosulfate reductase family protein, partial [Bacteroidota bacterium]
EMKNERVEKVTDVVAEGDEVKVKVLEIDNRGKGDEKHQVIKFNPLFEWSEEEVQAYIRANKVPYNALQDRGYKSIGCAPCTRATLAGESERSGRWWWEDSHKECGLHEISSPIQTNEPQAICQNC